MVTKKTGRLKSRAYRNFSGSAAESGREKTRRRNSPVPASRIEALIAELDSADPLIRSRARTSLVGAGKPALTRLSEVLAGASSRVRWEAAQALVEIREPGAAPALVAALEDDAQEVRWAVAEGLIDLGHDGLIPLLRQLVIRSGSIRLREGAHRILSALSRGDDGPVVRPVKEAIESSAPIVALPVAAHHALNELKNRERHSD